MCVCMCVCVCVYVCVFTDICGNTDIYAGKTGDFEWTALHVAASRGFPHVCQALRDIGADTDICDALGNDAYAVSMRQHTSAYVSIRQHT